MQYEQPRELLKFIETLKINTNGSFVRNALDNSIIAVSGYFTPQGKVSQLASTVHSAIKSGDVFTALLGQKETSSLTSLIKDSTLRYDDPFIYQMLQAIVTEGFSLVYATENQPELMYYYSKEDASRLHENINYVADILAQKDNTLYYDVINELRNLDTDTMYLYSLVNTSSLTDSGTQNSIGHNNLITDSGFENINQTWDITGNGLTVENGRVEKNGSVETVTLRSTVIPVVSNMNLSYTATTTGDVDILATDINGSTLPEFVDYWGNVITDGVISQATEINGDEKSSHQLLIPENVKYVRMRVTLKANNVAVDYLQEPMMAVGGVIGKYVKG